MNLRPSITAEFVKKLALVCVFLFKFIRGIPEGHRAPLADILHSDTRSVNTQTPNRDLMSSGKQMKNFFVCEFGDFNRKTHSFH